MSFAPAPAPAEFCLCGAVPTKLPFSSRPRCQRCLLTAALALFRVCRALCSLGGERGSALGPDNKGTFLTVPSYLHQGSSQWESVHPTGQSPPWRQLDGVASIDTTWSLYKPGLCNEVLIARVAGSP